MGQDRRPARAVVVWAGKAQVVVMAGIRTFLMVADLFGTAHAILE